MQDLNEVNIMAYNTPELQRVGTAQNLVLGVTGKLPGTIDNCEFIGSEDYQLNGAPDESEW